MRSACRFFICLYVWITAHRMGRNDVFISSLGDGNLSDFHLLTLRNNATINISVQVLVGHKVLLLGDTYLGVELLGQMITLYLTF